MAFQESYLCLYISSEFRLHYRHIYYICPICKIPSRPSISNLKKLKSFRSFIASSNEKWIASLMEQNYDAQPHETNGNTSRKNHNSKWKIHRIQLCKTCEKKLVGIIYARITTSAQLQYKIYHFLLMCHGRRSTCLKQEPLCQLCIVTMPHSTVHRGDPQTRSKICNNHSLLHPQQAFSSY